MKGTFLIMHDYCLYFTGCLLYANHQSTGGGMNDRQLITDVEVKAMKQLKSSVALLQSWLAVM